MIRTLARWWRSLPARLSGSYVRDRSEHAVKLSGFAACDRAVSRRMARLIEEQPDVPAAPKAIPVDFERLPP